MEVIAGGGRGSGGRFGRGSVAGGGRDGQGSVLSDGRFGRGSDVGDGNKGVGSRRILALGALMPSSESSSVLPSP